MHYQSPVNIVPFRNRVTGEHMALTPSFPDIALITRNGRVSLNTMVSAAYRALGVRPEFIEDRFSAMGGNTHCAVVALH
jgi:hypothetical protein